MRMWMVNPKIMCKQHLLGEHVECHMASSCIKLNKSLKGHVEKGQLEVHNIKSRHKELVKEMKKRGYNHQSKLKSFKPYKAGLIDRLKNIEELARRCKECKKRIKPSNRKA